MKLNWHFFAAIVVGFCVSGAANAERSIEEIMTEFRKDPKTFMNKVPEKTGPKGVQKFSQEDIDSGNYVTIKANSRPLQGRSGMSGNDLPRNLVDNGGSMILTPGSMERSNLLQARLQDSPWSDNYWPLFIGQLAWRYADSDYPRSKDWEDNYNYHMEGNSTSVARLSPAEKYDLLVGDRSKSLTRAALGEGKYYHDTVGKVETWMGICHGWAPASYMLGRPTKAVKVLAADGQTWIPFYPSDIKALASLLWAKFTPNNRMIGVRCDAKKPATDRNGRIRDQNCFDTNPATFHLALVNQIGASRRSMIMDATYDYEIWNQPIYAYSFTYFNPETLRPSSSARTAAVKMSDFSEDRFRGYRSPSAAYVVGVNLKVTYVSETNPSTATSDSAANDLLKTVQYQYDLELDNDGNAIGGEWYNNYHPDFLWTPAPNARALTPGDEAIISSGATGWNRNSTVPGSWMGLAQQVSRNSRAPLAHVVEHLIWFSNIQ